MRTALLCWWLFGAAATWAQQPAPAATPPPRKILFVGNSFTHGKYLPVRTYNAAAVVDENAGLPADDPRAFHPPGEEGTYGGIPGIFKKLADDHGLNYEVHIEAVSAKDLAFHYKNALPVLTRPGWDVVVLQGYSTESLPAGRGGKPEEFQANVLLLERAIHAANPHSKIYLEETWPRADLIYPEKATYYGGTVHTMNDDLRAGNDHAASAANGTGSGPNVHSIMVGDGWGLAITRGIAQENPYLPAEPGKLDLWGADHYHPSIYGAYLSAVDLFTQIALISQTDLRASEPAAYDLGISPADAARLNGLEAIVYKAAPAKPGVN